MCYGFGQIFDLVSTNSQFSLQPFPSLWSRAVESLQPQEKLERFQLKLKYAAFGLGSGGVRVLSYATRLWLSPDAAPSLDPLWVACHSSSFVACGYGIVLLPTESCGKRQNGTEEKKELVSLLVDWGALASLVSLSRLMQLVQMVQFSNKIKSVM